jgi:ribosomal protein L7/L12
MADVKQIAETLVNLTVKEVNELAAILKDEYGIEPAAAAPVMVAGAAAGSGAGAGALISEAKLSIRGNTRKSITRRRKPIITSFTANFILQMT